MAAVEVDLDALDSALTRLDAGAGDPVAGGDCIENDPECIAAMRLDAAPLRDRPGGARACQVRAGVARIAQRVAVGVGLIRVGHARTVIHAVDHRVVVGIEIGVVAPARARGGLGGVVRAAVLTIRRAVLIGVDDRVIALARLQVATVGGAGVAVVTGAYDAER